MPKTPCLIVDDSGVVRKISRKILEDFGFEVFEAENGKVALELAQENQPEFILLDLDMPVMNGLEFIKEFRRSTGNKDVKVIFFTSENDYTTIMSGMESGINEYIMKPFDASGIKAKLVKMGIIK